MSIVFGPERMQEEGKKSPSNASVQAKNICIKYGQQDISFVKVVICVAMRLRRDGKVPHTMVARRYIWTKFNSITVNAIDILRPEALDVAVCARRRLNSHKHFFFFESGRLFCVQARLTIRLFVEVYFVTVNSFPSSKTWITAWVASLWEKFSTNKYIQFGIDFRTHPEFIKGTQQGKGTFKADLEFVTSVSVSQFARFYALVLKLIWEHIRRGGQFNEAYNGKMSSNRGWAVKRYRHNIIIERANMGRVFYSLWLNGFKWIVLANADTFEIEIRFRFIVAEQFRLSSLTIPSVIHATFFTHTSHCRSGMIVFVCVSHTA